MSKEESSQRSGPRRSGRRPGSSVSRQAILDAARSRFAEDSYAATTVRGIAADAGVDASLVIRCYGSKEALFAKVMALPPEALDRLAAAFDGPVATIGERVTRAFLDLWEIDPQTSEPLMRCCGPRSATSKQRRACASSSRTA